MASTSTLFFPLAYTSLVLEKALSYHQKIPGLGQIFFRVRTEKFKPGSYGRRRVVFR